MGHTSRSSSATALRAPQRDAAYTRLAELAAREAEINRYEAARRRAWREAERAYHVIHSIGIRLAEPPRSARPQAEQAGESEVNRPDFTDARLTELQERERALAEREKLIAMLEALLDRSRQRLEEQLDQLVERKAALEPTPRLGAVAPPSAAIGYVGPGSYHPVRQESRVAGDLRASAG
jgi:flagellar biosynthesis/type III secretory pathway protein FliH